MKRLLTILTVAVPAALSSTAAHVTPDEALERALSCSQLQMRAPASGYTLAQTRNAGGTDVIYIFQPRAAKGFLLTPADNSLPAILGYGTSELCDESGNFAPAFEYWLGELERQALYAASHPEAVRQNSERPFRTPIPPLCSTRWNQSAPYNNLCPEVDGRTSVTGCVATAMSQVMKYHNWPPTGEGYNEYEWQGQVLSMDFSTQTFDWNQMLNGYYPVFDGYVMTIDATKEQQEAVARLMAAAGYSVNMNYSPEASGAISIMIGNSLGKYFRYDRSMRYLKRDYFPLEEWEEIIYNSLSEDGPVIYDGQANIGGHSFVCDGYDKEGYFHFNWGWGGTSDGYFLLDALDPIEQGIGGADSGFNYMQDIIVNIRPDRTGDSRWSATVISDSGMDAGYSRKSNTVTINNMIYNSGPGDIGEGQIGIRITDRLDNTSEPLFLVEMFESLPVMYGFRSMEFEMPDLADGQYDMIPVYAATTQEDAMFMPVMMPYGTTRSYSFLIRSGKLIVFSPTEKFETVAVTDIPEDTCDAENGQACEYYTLQGIKAATKSAGQPRPELPEGIYIVRSSAGTSKITAR